jgi:predicted nucleotidyltransferase component of viral defense system
VIPRDYITEWRAEAPWAPDFQVEQDLVICRALVAIFTHPVLAKSLAFRGGTALYKLHLKPPARYSEDIDLVQVNAEPAGPLMDALHEALDGWLGKPRYKQSEGRVTLTYRFSSEDAPPLPLKLKVEINSREHFAVYGFKTMRFSVSSRWFDGACDVLTYELDELLGTKLRALYQRRKGRDLFDLALALENPDVDPARVVAAFQEYMKHGGHRVGRAQFEENLAAKLNNQAFNADIGPLLATDAATAIAGGLLSGPLMDGPRLGGPILRRKPSWDIAAATDAVSSRLVAILPEASGGN